MLLTGSRDPNHYFAVAAVSVAEVLLVPGLTLDTFVAFVAFVVVGVVTDATSVTVTAGSYVESGYVSPCGSKGILRSATYLAFGGIGDSLVCDCWGSGNDCALWLFLPAILLFAPYISHILPRWILKKHSHTTSKAR